MREVLIPANDFRRQWEDISADVHRAVDRVGASAWYILGAEVKRFEAALAALWGLPHAIGTGNGLDAIEIGLRVLGCRRGSRVLTTPLSAFATTLAILRAGGTPVFVDCDDQGLVRLDLAEQIFQQDPSIRFFVPVHLYGFPLDLDELDALRDRFELAIVEDCAQSVLASWNGRHTGSCGSMAATSFYPTKNLGALGDGGAILTRDPSLAAEAAALRDYGQTSKYRHTRLGLNSRLDELQAAILHDAMLPRLAEWTSRRNRIAQKYDEGIRNPRIHRPRPRAGSNPCRHLYPVFVPPDSKGAFLAHLRAWGVGASEHYPLCIVDQEALQSAPFELATPCSNAARLARSEVSLPIHPYLTDAEIQTVVDACNSWRG